MPYDTNNISFEEFAGKTIKIIEATDSRVSFECEGKHYIGWSNEEMAVTPVSKDEAENPTKYDWI